MNKKTSDGQPEDKGPEDSIQSQGGKARAKKLTAVERSEIARAAALARHEKTGPPLPKATHEGTLTIGEMNFPCSVLSDGMRIITQSDFMEQMGMYYSGWVAKNKPKDQAADLPHFLSFTSLQPFISRHLGELQSIVVKYRTMTGGVAHGIRAEIIPKICEIWMDADEGTKLGARQHKIAQRAKIMMRALAYVGIIALVDEATGYQYDRPRRDLEEQLKQFLSEDLRRYARTFPADYFKHLCRLRGVEVRHDMKLPQYFGKLTNNLIYRRIAPGLLKKLKERREERGKKSNKLFRWLSEDIGDQSLLLQLGATIGLMKVNTNYDVFEKQMDTAYPIYPDYPGLFDDPKDWNSPE